MDSPQRVVVAAPEDAVTTEALGTQHIRMTAAQTGGRLGVFDIVVLPGEGPPMHVHDREDEFFRILEGTLDIWCGTDHAVAGAGACVFLPRGIPHRFQNITGAEARAMVMVTPGRFEGFFGALQPRMAEGVPAAIEVGAAFGLSFTPP
jgi:mannose-6-phosphate isomerase-like protein (cupin superfamily)